MMFGSKNGTGVQANNFYVATQFQKRESKNSKIVIDKEGKAKE